MKSIKAITFALLTLSITSLMASEQIAAVLTDHAPKAIGPYSQAIIAGDFLFVSGQIGIDPETGKLVEGIEEQTKQVLKNIEAILSAKGLTFENVVRSEVFLKDLQDFKTMNTIYSEKFSHEIKPARQTIQVAKLPLDAAVEISCVAFIGK